MESPISTLHPSLVGAFVLASCALSPGTVLNPSDVLDDWTAGANPITGADPGSWTLTGSGLGGGYSHAQSLVSDFSATGPFSFSVSSQHTDANHFGVLWGFQDQDNHFRMNWGPSEFTIERELGGISTVLYSSTMSFVDGAHYAFSLEATGSGYDVMVSEGSTALFHHSFLDSTFETGQVGVYDSYCWGSGMWTDFDFDQYVPTPSAAPSVPDSATTLPLLGLSLMGLMALRRKMRN